jgi:Cytochrome P460
LETRVDRLREHFREGEYNMCELVTKSVAQEQKKQKAETRPAVRRIAGFTIAATAVAALAVLVAAAVYAQAAQDKYSLKSPSGIAFSDFRGYEDWSVVSSARTDEVLKVIVANPTMINAYKSGIPGNGQPFPDGSMIAKLQWKPKKSTEAPFVVDVPDIFKQAFLMEKDSKRFAKSGGWGYAVFNYDAPTDKFSADANSPSDCGFACHTPVKAKDYIFHPYQKR